MYYKILIFAILLILSGFFYLHTKNPATASVFVTEQYTFVLPIILLLFISFAAGVVLTVINSIIADARRGLRGMRTRRQARQAAQADDNYADGMEALRTGDLRQARITLRKAVSAKPADCGMRLGLSETYLREGNYTDAVGILEEGAAKCPKATELHTAIARICEETGEVHRAMRALEDLLDLDPKNPYALKRLRDYHMKGHDWPDAVKLQQVVLDTTTDDVSRKRERRLMAGLLYETARVETEAQKYDDAASRIKWVIKNEPSFVPAKVLQGEIYLKRGEITRALNLWEDVLDTYPESVPVLLKLEDLYLKRSEPERIIDIYHHEINTKENGAVLRLLLSRLYLRLEMVDKAIEELDVIRREGNEGVYLNILLGAAHSRRNEGEKAIEYYGAALGLDDELTPPFTCQRCGSFSIGWNARCPSCGDWDAFEVSATVASLKAGATALGRMRR